MFFLSLALLGEFPLGLLQVASGGERGRAGDWWVSWRCREGASMCERDKGL
jgi:hypothetical protein